jgi:hypothetical protein
MQDEKSRSEPAPGTQPNEAEPPRAPRVNADELGSIEEHKTPPSTKRSESHRHAPKPAAEPATEDDSGPQSVEPDERG